MKRMQKRIMALILSVLMTMSLVCIQALAADTKTVQINGYTDDKTPEEIAAAKPQLEISNVSAEIKLDSSIKITAITYEGEELWTKAENIDAAYNAAAPVTITTLDDGSLFEVYKLDETGNILNFDFDQSIPHSTGKVQVEDMDGKQRTVNIGDITDDDYLLNMLPGCAVTLTEPGAYYVLFRYEALSDSTEIIVNVGDSGVNLTSFPLLTVHPGNSDVIVDGQEMTFDAYLINGNNYIRLRDFAKAVSGTTKQFEITWDGPNNAIYLASRLPYTPVGNELTAGDGTSKAATPCASKILHDGTEIALAGYNIGGTNYFKLRDIARAFDIGVIWYGETRTVGIDTSIGYSD